MNSTRYLPFFQRVTPLVSLIAMVCVLSPSPVTAQTVIYDGDEQLNFFSGGARLTDDFMLAGTPANPDRAGIIESGADPNVLEVGDAAWFKGADRRMDNVTGVGLAGSAVGVDGAFMTGTPNGTNVSQGVGAGYVLYDAKTTTGMQTLNISLYYNDPTPNAPEPDITNRNTGGGVGIRVVGIQATDPNNPDVNPWGDDDFQYGGAGSGHVGHHFGGGRHRANSDTGDQPVVESLFYAESSYDEPDNPGDEDLNPDEFLTPSDEWQQLSFNFDAGTGYDYLIFSVGGVGQNDLSLPNTQADRFGFDNISFEAASSSVPGDFTGDGLVNDADIDALSANLGQPATTNPAMDLDNNNTIELADHDLHITTQVMDSNGTGALIGDLNFDGDVDVSQIVIGGGGVQNFGDASVLLASLGQTSGQLYADGDLNGDGDVDVSEIVIGGGGVQNLGDASRLLANLGQTTAAAPAASAVPEPGSLAILALAGIGAVTRRRR